MEGFMDNIGGGIGAGLAEGIKSLFGGKNTEETKYVPSDCSWIEGEYQRYAHQFTDLQAKVSQCDASLPETEAALRALDANLNDEETEVRQVSDTFVQEVNAIKLEVASLEAQLQGEQRVLKNNLDSKEEFWKEKLSSIKQNNEREFRELQAQLLATKQQNEARDSQIAAKLATETQRQLELAQQKKQQLLEQLVGVENNIGGRRKRDTGKDLYEMVNESRAELETRGTVCNFENVNSVFALESINEICNQLLRLQ